MKDNLVLLGAALIGYLIGVLLIAHTSWFVPQYESEDTVNCPIFECSVSLTEPSKGVVGPPGPTGRID